MLILKKINFFILLLFTICLVNFKLPLVSAWAIEGPALAVEPEEFNLGYITKDSRSYCSFLITNRGTEELEVQKVIPSCGCTTYQLDKNKLLPGEMGRLEIVFNSRGFFGRVKKKILIKSNDPTQPQKTVCLVAVVEEKSSPYPAHPPVLKFSSKKRREVLRILQNQQESPVEIALVWKPDFLTAKFLSRQAALRQNFRIQLKLATTDFSSLPPHSSLTLEFSDVPKTRISLPVIIGEKSALSKEKETPEMPAREVEEFGE